MRGDIRQNWVSKAEWRWALVGVGLVAIVACLPYVYAQLAAPPGQTFGGFLINVQDGNSYLAKMRQGYEGEWLYRLAFSPEDQRGILVFTLYLGLGQLARLTGLPMMALYHAGRIVGAAAMLLTTYVLAAELTTEIGARRWAFAIAAFGSGLGLVSQLIGRATIGFVPVDFYTPEANSFYSILTNPHFPLMAAFEALALLWVFKPPFPRQPLVVQCIPLVLVGLGVVSFAPYLGPVVGVVVVAGLAVLRPSDSGIYVRTAALGAAMIALLAYNLWELQTNPAIMEWARQNQTPSPPLLDTLMGLGVWLPLAVVGAYRVWKTNRPVSRAVAAALVVWIVLTLVLMYVPYPLQRRFVGGVFMPVGILAGVGTHWVVTSLLSLRRVLVLAVLIAFGFSSNGLILLVTFTAPRQADTKMYLTNDEAAALNWLELRVSPDDVVLADTRLGNFVPGWTGARSVYGHSIETMNAEAKQAEVTDYYESGPNTDLLERYHVQYVIGGDAPDGWQLVFESGSVKVYGR